METTSGLALPTLSRGRFLRSGAENDAIWAYTDEELFRACGVRIAFTERTGGVSEGPYASLNLGSHVKDDPAAVEANRHLVMECMGAGEAQLIVPNQVHGSHVVCVDAPGRVAAAQDEASQGADALVVSAPDVAALLCFADCTPVIMAAPDGSFAVAHAGWRGVYAHIAVLALQRLCAVSGARPEECNIYIGPYIHAECFEVSADLARTFATEFGQSCTPDGRHVDMGQALRIDLARSGALLDRIADAGACTVCDNDRFYSYRAAGGTCGRHGAFAVRMS